jgi:hypothetical protein
VLTSGEFLARLAVDETPVVEDDEGADVDMDCWGANARSCVKLTGETEQVDPAAPTSRAGLGSDVNVMP